MLELLKRHKKTEQKPVYGSQACGKRAKVMMIDELASSPKEPAISIEYHGIENVERRRQIENSMHLNRLAEIADGYSEEEALIICNIFAKKYPHALYSTLIKEHASLLGFKNGVNELNVRYMERN